MESQEIVKFIEDKAFVEQEQWFLHATEKDIEVIKGILNDGIKCAHLMNTVNSTGCNGQYYISLYKNDYNSRALCQRFENDIKFIVQGIHPHYAKREKYDSRNWYIDSRIPLRTSHYDGEYHQYLRINPDKFVGVDYQLSRIIPSLSRQDRIRELAFLREVVQCIGESNSNLPIYDLASHREINKDKVLSIIL